MNRNSLKKYTHIASNFLSLEYSNYKQWVFRYTFLELEKDLGTKGDITTNSLFEKQKKVSAQVIAKEDGVIAGLNEINYFLVESDSNFRPRINNVFELDFKFKDGEEVKKGDVIFNIKAELHDLLAVERVVLNFLMRMSGVATFTKKLVMMLGDSNVLLAPTRKTLWGLLDKKAVYLGGGGTHRLNLSDAVLVKDNHLDSLKRDIPLIFKRLALKEIDCRFIEIEVENKDEAVKVCQHFVKYLDLGQLKAAGIVLFDNMSPEDIASALNEIKKQDLYERIIFEASGGINEKNLLEYSNTGVDIISMSRLTMGVKPLDINLEIR